MDERKDALCDDAAIWAAEHHEGAIALAIEAHEAGDRARQG